MHSYKTVGRGLRHTEYNKTGVEQTFSNHQLLHVIVDLIAYRSQLVENLSRVSSDKMIS
jgi:hypothetical protein